MAGARAARRRRWRSAREKTTLERGVRKVKDFPNNNQTQTIYNLMLASFSQTEVIELYFLLGIDPDNVPKPANKQTYIEFLVRFMASRNSQKALIAQLKYLRPKLDWPNTFTISTDMLTTQASKPIYFEQHVGEQHINIYTDTKNSTKPRSWKSRFASKGKQLQAVEEEIYQKIFRFTPHFAWVLLSVTFAFIIGLLFLLLFNKEFLNNYGLLLLVFILITIGVVPRLIFKYVLNLLRKSTKFYDLNVTDRTKVKYLLQKRIWGNKFINLLCKTLIKLLLETDLRRANRRI